MRILCSEPGRKAVQARVARIARERGERAYEFVLPSDLSVAHQGFDIAFVSRDVTGRSTKHEMLPHTQVFYDALLASHTLRWVHVHSAGVDRPVYQQLMAKGVRVTGSPGTNASIVAQSALAGLLALSRRLPLLMHVQRLRQWQPLHGDLIPADLQGQRITIVGWGAIGQQIAAYARMLGLQITVARHSGVPVVGDVQTIANTQLLQVLPHTDWLVLACPATAQTYRLIDAAALAALPKHAHVLNLARGDVIDESALIGALQTQQLAGAFLDVFAHEPLPTASALWDLDNVIVTPHCAGFSSGNETRVATMFADNLARYLAGDL